jgi:DNA-binding transcriptional regulator YhcF (GntR family)
MFMFTWSLLMTDPTQLSPAAQAVLDAVEDDCIHPDDKHRIAAAALRAVVQELKYFGITEKNILAIAAELEAQ